VRRRIE
jgi:U4/U6.U5 tri-snRNP-associated protein 3